MAHVGVARARPTGTLPPMPPLQPPAPFVIERLVRLALEEDAGRGDVTTAACVPPSLIGAATLRAIDFEA